MTLRRCGKGIITLAARIICWCVALAIFVLGKFFSDSGIDPPSLRGNHRNPTGAKHAKERGRRVRFVPFPHRSIGGRDDVQCDWITAPIPHNNASSPPYEYDAIQRAIYAEGLCLPRSSSSSSSPSFNNTTPQDSSSSLLNTGSLHIFSTSEAIECLSPTAQGLNISLIVGGDSYTRNLFIGLADILLGRPSNNELIKQNHRLGNLSESSSELQSRHANDENFPNVHFPEKCLWECYGRGSRTQSFSTICSNCTNQYTQYSPHAIAVVGAGVHVLKHFGRAVNATIADMQNFFAISKNTMYVSMPSYEVEKIPMEYREAMHHTHAGRLYEGLLESLAPNVAGHPFLDVFPLTRACVWENCSVDGGHRARFVNRWKAQLLLNTLCEVE